MINKNNIFITAPQKGESAEAFNKRATHEDFMRLMSSAGTRRSIATIESSMSRIRELHEQGVWRAETAAQVEELEASVSKAKRELPVACYAAQKFLFNTIENRGAVPSGFYCLDIDHITGKVEGASSALRLASARWSPRFKLMQIQKSPRGEGLHVIIAIERGVYKELYRCDESADGREFVAVREEVARTLGWTAHTGANGCWDGKTYEEGVLDPLNDYSRRIFLSVPEYILYEDELFGAGRFDEFVSGHESEVYELLESMRIKYDGGMTKKERCGASARGSSAGVSMSSGASAPVVAGGGGV